MNEESPYFLLSIFLGIAILFPLIPIGMAYGFGKLFSPGKPGNDKNASYECGIEETGTARIQFKAQYYLYGIIFLIFDVEAAFLIPIAVSFLKLPVSAVLATLVFMLLLLEGLAWAWAKGVLIWK